MLVRMMYASRAADTVNDDELAAILRVSRRRNLACGVTGVLCLTNDIFLQVIEGGRTAVSTLYNRIVTDPRHRDVELLHYAEIGERRFAGWSMGQVNLNRLNPGVVLKYSETGVLNPYAMPGSASVALFEELLASASIMA